MRDVKLRFRTFVHATEVEDRVAKAMLAAMGVEEEPEARSRLETSRMKGHHGNEIRVLEATLSRGRDVRRCLDRLMQGWPETAATLRSQLDERLDIDEGVFRFRLDKQAAVEGRLEVTRSGDAVQVELRVARLPGLDLAERVAHLLAGQSTNV